MTAAATEKCGAFTVSWQYEQAAKPLPAFGSQESWTERQRRRRLHQDWGTRASGRKRGARVRGADLPPTAAGKSSGWFHASSSNLYACKGGGVWVLAVMRGLELQGDGKGKHETREASSDVACWPHSPTRARGTAAAAGKPGSSSIVLPCAHV